MLHDEGGPQFELEDESYEVIQSMLAHRERNGGLITAFHGTSATRAREIAASGLENRLAVDGRSGVFAWDESMKDNAVYFGIDRAKKDGDKEYAVLTLEMTNPEPDYLQGRMGEWKSNAQNTRIVDISYHSVE